MIVFVKPAEGALIRHPDTKTPVPEHGEHIDLDADKYKVFWRKRIREGSLIICNDNE